MPANVKVSILETEGVPKPNDFGTLRLSFPASVNVTFASTVAESFLERS
jgi:hypothetical protein